MKKKALFFAPVGLTSKQVGLNAEVMHKLVDQGMDVFVVRCGAVLNNCYSNRVHNPLACASCQARIDFVQDIVGVDPDQIIMLKYIDEGRVVIPHFNSTEELISYSMHGIDVGRGVASSIISYVRDFDITTKKYPLFIEVELRKAINVLLNFEVIFEEVQPDEVYIFNGRLAEVHPVVQLAKKKNIPFWCIEAGSLSRYQLFENALPHSIVARTRQMRNLWQSASLDSRDSIGMRWFEGKRVSDETFEKSFVSDQAAGKLPDKFLKDKINILLLNSSEDEIKAIGEWNTDLYSSQNEAIVSIVSHFADHHEYHFYLRVHPNLGKVSNQQMTEIDSFEFRNLTVVAPEADIDTYGLIDACDKVVAFGTTSGIEATYWGTPAILYGNSFYRDLNVTYNPKTFEELVTLIADKTLKALPKENTFIYGYYMSSYGTDTVYFEHKGIWGSSFNGRRLRVLYLSAIPKLLRYLFPISTWLRLRKQYYGKKFSWRMFGEYV